MSLVSDVLVQTLSWRQWPAFAAIWARIYSMCPDASFFLSPDWVDCWLATFAEELNPELAAFTRDDEVVGCCVLVCRAQRVRGIPVRRVYLNCDGEDEIDSTCIEYNSLLCLPDCAEGVANALAGLLEKRSWDEFVLRGVVERSPVCAMAGGLGAVEISARPSHYVDLRAIRDAAAFDAVLSSNTRHQVRRSQRLYEQAGGPCVIRVAQTGCEAAAIFERLAEFHQASWRDRGRPGVFASSRFNAFHRRLIEAGFERGRILLMEARAGGEPIGALYCFLDRGRVYFYQSGFRYSEDNRLKPGVLTHYLAIRYCIERQEIEEYDFLAGDSQYKRSLATATRPLQWIVVRRATASNLLLRGLRIAKRTCVQMLEGARKVS